jgi:hypothetical protein
MARQGTARNKESSVEPGTPDDVKDVRQKPRALEVLCSPSVFFGAWKPGRARRGTPVEPSKVNDQQSNTAPDSSKIGSFFGTSKQINKASARVPYSLLALPAELCLQIYGDCFAPTGILCLTSSATHRRTLSITTFPSLLATCRQIHAEVLEYLARKNTICIIVDAQTAMTTAKLVGSRLPPHVVPKLRRLCLILDYRGPIGPGFTFINDNVFASMTSLKHVRVAVVVPLVSWKWAERWSSVGYLLYLVRKRLPAQAQLQFGAAPRSFEHRIELDLGKRRTNNPPGEGWSSSAASVAAPMLEVVFVDKLRSLNISEHSEPKLASRPREPIGALFYECL